MKTKLIIPANTLKKGDVIDLKSEIKTFDPTVDNYIIIKEITIKKQNEN